MPTVEALLHYRWHRVRERVRERVNALLCLKGTWDHVEDPPRRSARKRKRTDGVDASPLRVSEAREKIPKVLWREILEYL
jgi:hypothetical protein